MFGRNRKRKTHIVIPPKETWIRRTREAEALLAEARRIIDGMDSYASLGGCPMRYDWAADEWRSKLDAFLSDTEDH